MAKSTVATEPSHYCGSKTVSYDFYLYWQKLACLSADCCAKSMSSVLILRYWRGHDYAQLKYFMS